MPKRILIVDDTATMRSVSNFTLTRAGFTVIEAESAEDALEQINGAMKENLPDMIISDVNMTGKTGLEMAALLKEDPATSAIPILMLTTEASKELANQGREIGVTAWIVKPFVPEVLIAAIHKILGTTP